MVVVIVVVSRKLSSSVSRLAKKSTFAEGEEVIVYDIRSKLSSNGKITDLLGTNTYLADYGKGPQHISGDVISRISDVAQRPVGQNNEVPEQPGQTAKDDVLMDQEDGMSIVSESSMDSEGVQEVIIPEIPIPRRRRRMRADRLGPVKVQWLRPRRR